MPAASPAPTATIIAVAVFARGAHEHQHLAAIHPDLAHLERPAQSRRLLAQQVVHEPVALRAEGERLALGRLRHAEFRPAQQRAVAHEGGVPAGGLHAVLHRGRGSPC